MGAAGAGTIAADGARPKPSHPPFPSGGRGLPADPWGNPYRYANPGPNGGIQILSLGADNAPGGEGENADVRNKQ